jgi:hypothetical protein
MIFKAAHCLTDLNYGNILHPEDLLVKLGLYNRMDRDTNSIQSKRVSCLIYTFCVCNIASSTLLPTLALINSFSFSLCITLLSNLSSALGKSSPFKEFVKVESYFYGP